MANKSKKAIKVLKSHLRSISSIKNVQEGNTWKATLKDTLKLYLGNESSLLSRLDNLHFTKAVASDNPNVISMHHIYDETKKQNFINLITETIKYIQTNGIYKNPNKKNMLSSFNNTTIISGVVTIITISFGIGKYFGENEKDKDTLRLEESFKNIELENNNLSDTISSLRLKLSLKNSTDEEILIKQ